MHVACNLVLVEAHVEAIPTVAPAVISVASGLVMATPATTIAAATALAFAFAFTFASTSAAAATTVTAPAVVSAANRRPRHPQGQEPCRRVER